MRADIMLEREEKDIHEDIKRIVAQESVKTSEKIRRLFLLGVDVMDIAILLNISYNFAYNVVKQYSKAQGIPVTYSKSKIKAKNVYKEPEFSLWDWLTSLFRRQ
jgi:uncharacterized protein YjaZ